jgi:hypothetical protein
LLIVFECATRKHILPEAITAGVPQVELKKIDSSNIKAAGFDQMTFTLFVQFKGGKIYSYGEVESRVYDDFMAAPSKGSFFKSNISGKYETQKLG